MNVTAHQCITYITLYNIQLHVACIIYQIRSNTIAQAKTSYMYVSAIKYVTYRYVAFIWSSYLGRFQNVNSK